MKHSIRAANRGAVTAPSRRVAWLVMLLVALIGVLRPATGQVAAAPAIETVPPGESAGIAVLSPYWEPGIQRWGDTIGALAEVYGFHPDFIAAVIKHESGGEYRAISRRGAVGLMDVMAEEPVWEWRPSSEALLMATTDLRWGLAILSYVVQQAGGDLYTALAAYNGGWEHVNSRIPREYAARVLDSYARALLARAGLPLETATRWTVAVDIRAGNVPDETLLVLGYEPIAGLHTLARHTVYAFADDAGHVYYVRGYVVPVGLSASVASDSGVGDPDELEAALRARLGEKSALSATGNPRVLLACLAGLTRLRGQVTTRWYAPSGCPSVER